MAWAGTEAGMSHTLFSTSFLRTHVQLKQIVTPGGQNRVFSILSFPRTQLGLGTRQMLGRIGLET